MLIAREALAAIAFPGDDSVHIDLGPLLGTNYPVRIGLDDVHELLQTSEPAFDVQMGNATVTVRKQDGGFLAGLTVRF